MISKQDCLAIGLMSGTSMDGVDAALIETDGENYVNSLGNIFLPYPPDFQLNESTEWHIRAIKQLQAKIPKANTANIIGYHGQTTYHNPAKKITAQIGDGQLMAKAIGIPVVNHFRENDIQHGGQGAPLTPLYHRALAIRDNLTPCIVVNCGGIANLTIITGTSDQEIWAYDAGPGNGLIDRFVKIKTDNAEKMDQDGQYGSQGNVKKKLLAQLFESLKSYYQKSPPKSLDINDFQLPIAFENISIQDGCATLAAFTAQMIAESLKLLPNLPPIEHWMLAGGGWKNPCILKALKQYLPPEKNIQTADQIGWHSDALEAEAFAYLAIRHLKGLPLSLPNTTGTSKPTTGGEIYYP